MSRWQRLPDDYADRVVRAVNSVNGEVDAGWARSNRAERDARAQKFSPIHVAGNLSKGMAEATIQALGHEGLAAYRVVDSPILFSLRWSWYAAWRISLLIWFFWLCATAGLLLRAAGNNIDTTELLPAILMVAASAEAIGFLAWFLNRPIAEVPGD